MSLRSELRKKGPYSAPEEELSLNLQRTHGLVVGPVARFLRLRGISPPLYNILRILRGQDGEGLPCQEISGRMVTREPDVTRLVDKLVRDGLATRQRSPQDGRVVLVAITARGRRLLAKLDDPVRELHRDTLGHLQRDEMNELNRLLVKARQP